MRIALVVVLACCGGTPAVAPPVSGVAPRRAAVVPTPAPVDPGPVEPTAGHDVDARDDRGWTPLQQAAQRGDLAQLSALIARGADLDARAPAYDGATAVELALQFSRPEAAQLLLDHGASTAGAIGPRLLALAGREGAVGIVEQLARRGVPVAGSHALRLAAKYGHAAAITALLRLGADANGADPGDHDFTPLMIASMEGQLEAARALLDAGARIDAVDDDGSTALHWAVFAARPDKIHRYRSLDQPHDTVYRAKADAPLVALLLARGARVDPVDVGGNTPLHDAAMFDAAAAAQILVRHGAARARRNRDGKTPLQLARARANSVVEVLRATAGAGPARATRP